MDKKPFHETVALSIIEQLKQGCAPWQRPWQPGSPHAMMPVNPVTGTRYKGANAIALMAQGYSDVRWMTYNQALSAKAQVRKGEKGTAVQYWKFTETQIQKDAQGKPLLKSDGTPLTHEVPLERPRVFYATVFNAAQIDGLPPKEQQIHTWNAIERAERILQQSGARLIHQAQNNAFYRPATDTIYLPEKNQFPSAHHYYATALHELAHWSGHSSRMDRDFAHPFGSEGYAKEELRAEITSMILGDELGIGHDPGQHVAYIDSWIRVLQNDPLELFRAASDAEKMQQFLCAFELQQQLENEILPERDMDANTQTKPHQITRSIAEEIAALTQEQNLKQTSDAMNSADKIWLAVPYVQREAVKQLAGKLPDGKNAVSWDKTAKCWYALPGANLEALKPWILTADTPRQLPGMTPQQEFGDVLKSLGCELSNDHPIMDGNKHRIRVEGDKNGEKSGFYVGHQDGHPAGYVKNNRTGIEMKWKSKGYSLSVEDRASLQAQAAAKNAHRAQAQHEAQEQAAQRVRQQLTELMPVTAPTPYLEAKGIGVHSGIWTDKEGQTTFVPAFDATGQVQSMQYIQNDGTKRFAKNTRKEGSFHVVGGFEALETVSVLVIAEGYATASSLSEALNLPCVCAFDAGNLQPVAQALHERFPDKSIVITGDDDKHLEISQSINPGKAKALDAAKAVNGKALFPIFAPGEQDHQPKQFSDFNDLATKSILGKEGLKRQVQPIVNDVILKQGAHRFEPKKSLHQHSVQSRAVN
ncbi:TPA: elongation factor P hydroxylase [Legionella pneumophila]